MAFIYPGANNAYVPMAIAALQSNYSQNPDSFAVNRYTTVAKVPNMNGYYIYHDPREETRIDYSDQRDAVWADGAYPQVNFSKGHEFLPFAAKRYHEMFAIGDLAAQQADWNLIVDHADSSARRLMTRRTYNVLNAATTSGNWGANTATATALGGGNWEDGTDTAPYIQKSIYAAIVAIQKGTNATVTPKDLTLIVSPVTAQAMGASQEIRNYLKSSYVAQQWLEQSAGTGFYYGLPDPLYGVRVVVEDRVYNSAAHGVANTSDYILGNNALLVARPGALQGPLNTMSTLTLAMFEDMNMDLEHKQLAKLTEGVVWDNYDVIVRPQSGFLITSVIG